MNSTPILFLIFNRPDTTYIVFEKIREFKPEKLFIAADGPRENNLEDIKNCEKARAVIDHIDWDCDVKLLFREQNLGCGLGVSSAITWFFDHVEYGIILEDDCVPDLSFFDYATELLKRYKDEPRVMMIAGTNCLFNQVKRDKSYFFYRFYSVPQPQIFPLWFFQILEETQGTPLSLDPSLFRLVQSNRHNQAKFFEYHFPSCYLS